jgi:hypothetical protein
MTCEFCLRLQHDKFRGECKGIDHVAECPTKEVPKLTEENERFVWLFSRISHGLWNGMGGADLGVVNEVCELFGVPEGERPVILDKTIAVMRAVNEIRQKQ